ncbi:MULTISPECIES: carbohydrate ABC transporter permease [unclassified Leifsonia]|uniref:carbohydrate ABC transporter permease n=1 Tax=unclassified Leifsonia TaxID=2663824 RepID=UPI00035C35D7|nr:MULTISPECIES: sugar ABC transporter permease [unclassified Leifsonia]TDP98669.1 carbohydrate ABC transporter membrane protein 1 (CUT1 family) [Leifsonia sp. 115AMFTsu3.1]
MTDTASIVAPRETGAPRPSRSGRKAGRRPGAPRRTGVAYIFLAPFLILFIVFVLAPAVFGLWISLTNWSPFRATQKFIGLQNYIDLFTPGSATSGDFWQSMAATGIFTLASVPFLLIIPLLIAVLLNQRIRAGSFFRGVFFAPYVLGVAVISVIWKYLLDTQSGIINHLLGMIGLPDNLPWTVDVPWVWVTLAGVTVWWTMGFNTVIILAGLKGISPDLYEAAALDGAGAWRQFISVTLPGLRQVMTFVITITILASANMFGQAFLITKGGPGNTTRTAIMYIADQGLSQNNLAAAAAMSYVLFAFLAIISIINFRRQRERAEKSAS